MTFHPEVVAPEWLRHGMDVAMASWKPPPPIVAFGWNHGGARSLMHARPTARLMVLP
jgi:hypothetical protein